MKPTVVAVCALQFAQAQNPREDPTVPMCGATRPLLLPMTGNYGIFLHEPNRVGLSCPARPGGCTGPSHHEYRLSMRSAGEYTVALAGLAQPDPRQLRVEFMNGEPGSVEASVEDGTLVIKMGLSSVSSKARTQDTSSPTGAGAPTGAPVLLRDEGASPPGWGVHDITIKVCPQRLLEVAARGEPLLSAEQLAISCPWSTMPEATPNSVSVHAPVGLDLGVGAGGNIIQREVVVSLCAGSFRGELLGPCSDWSDGTPVPTQGGISSSIVTALGVLRKDPNLPPPRAGPAIRMNIPGLDIWGGRPPAPVTTSTGVTTDGDTSTTDSSTTGFGGSGSANSGDALRSTLDEPVRCGYLTVSVAISCIAAVVMFLIGICSGIYLNRCCSTSKTQTDLARC